jgi:hypothetical protein
MKQNPKPFSVEIKKSRVQGQRNHLPPRRLFATAPVEATKTFLREEPQVVAEPSAAPRILPSIVEPMWSSSEPVEPVRCKRPSGETGRDQIEFDLAASASEDEGDTPIEAPVLAKALSRTGIAAVVEDVARPVHDGHSAQGEGAKTKSRRPRKKTSGTVEQETASEPRPEAEMTVASVALSKVAQCRMTKRLAAASQLQRYERWKRRLHRAAW